MKNDKPDAFFVACSTTIPFILMIVVRFGRSRHFNVLVCTNASYVPRVAALFAIPAIPLTPRLPATAAAWNPMLWTVYAAAVW